MAYVPPAGDNVNFTFSGGYSPPSGDQVNFFDVAKNISKIIGIDINNIKKIAGVDIANIMKLIGIEIN